MGFHVRDADNPSASKTTAGTADRNTSGIGNALVAVLLGAAGMEITITELLAILDVPDGLTAYERRALRGLPAYTSDMELVDVETWATATDAEMVALDPTDNTDLAQINLLNAGSVPAGATGWASAVTINTASTIVIRIPLTAHEANYRLQAVVGSNTSYERGQFIAERARNSQYKYLSTLNANATGTYTIQHHGVDHHTKYHGELDTERVAEAFPLHIAEVQFSPNQILETAVPGNIRAYIRMMPETLPNASRARMSINGVWSAVEHVTDTFTLRTTFTPEQQTAIQTLMDTGGHIPVVIQFLTGNPPSGTVVYNWTTNFPYSEPFVFSAVSEDEAKTGAGTALRSWSVGRVALTARSQRPVARVDMLPNYIVRPEYKGKYKLIIQEFQTEFLTGVTKILIRIQGTVIHTENWTPSNIANTQRTIDFEITTAEAQNIIDSLTSNGSITHPETALCEISFVNASNVEVAQIYYSLTNLTADEVPGAAESHTVLSHQHTVNITTPDTDAWVATGYTLVAGKLVYLEVDDPPNTGTAASAQSQTRTGWFLSDTLIGKTAQTVNGDRTDRQGQILLEDMFMAVARDASNQLLLSRLDNRYDAVPLRIYHAEISTTVNADGKVVYGGDDRPANDIGKIGDTYLRRQSNGIGLYEKTAESTWTYRYALLLLPGYPTLNQRHEKAIQFAGNTLNWDYHITAEWANIPVGTRLKPGMMIRHHTVYFGCITEHDKATTAPDADSTNWTLLTTYGGDWTARAIGRGTIVKHADNPYLATADILATDVAPNHSSNTKWLQLNKPPDVVSYAELTIDANQNVPIPTASLLALNFQTTFVKSNAHTGIIARSSNAHEINLAAGTYQINTHIVLTANTDNRRNNITVQITAGNTVLDEKKYIDYIRGFNLTTQAIDSSHLITLASSGRIQVRIRRTLIEGDAPYGDLVTAADSTVTIRKL